MRHGGIAQALVDRDAIPAALLIETIAQPRVAAIAEINNIVRGGRFDSKGYREGRAAGGPIRAKDHTLRLGWHNGGRRVGGRGLGWI